MNRILIAGIGNIFLGDDAFGCEVLRELSQRPLAEGVRAMDFGIRGYDLAYALTERYEAVILVDAVPRGGLPGTLYLIEIDPKEAPQGGPESVDAHSLDPVRVLGMAQSLGGVGAKLYLVGCEPGVLEVENGEIGLTEPVRQAVRRAVSMIEELIGDLIGSITTKKTGLVPV